MSWLVAFDPSRHSLPANAGIFVISALIIWVAGNRLAHHADRLAGRSGTRASVLGLLLLGGITSLPEIAVTATVGADAHPALGVSNLLGGAAMQVVILAGADLTVGDRALSSLVPSGSVTRQGLAAVTLLGIVAVGTLVGDIPVLGVGAWTLLIVVAAVGFMWRLSRHDQASDAGRSTLQSSGRTIAVVLASGVAIVVAGYLVARLSEALAAQSGIGEGFVGAVFTSTSTSLPEIATVIGAVRVRRYVMAFSDIFGTNIFDVALVFLVDVTHPGGPALNAAGRFGTLVAVLAMAVTVPYLVRFPGRHRTFLWLGLDSWLVVSIYTTGLAVLYLIR